MGRVHQCPYKTVFLLFFRICTLVLIFKYVYKKIKFSNSGEFCINWYFKVTDATTSATDVKKLSLNINTYWKFFGINDNNTLKY
jgi:hypothetical protein